MRLRTILILSLLFVAATPASAHSDKRKEKGRGPKVERTIATEANVAVSACLISGRVRVRGWDRNEVRARSSEAAEIQFRREGEGPDTRLARKVELLIADEAQGTAHARSCESFSEIELDVPRGATVQLQTRDSDIEVADVAIVYVSTQNGDVSIERATKAVDAGTIGGGISLQDSSGTISLHSAGGNIDAGNVRPAQAGDIFEARSLAGDITLEGISHGQLKARTLNGSLCATGPLAKGGRYDLQTISGDLTLTLPENSSFRVTAKFSQGADVISDFPLTLSNLGSAPADPSPRTPAPPADPARKPDPMPKPEPASAPTPQDEIPPTVTKLKKDKHGRTVVATFALRRVEGVYGSGDAFMDLSSFSGTIHLRKQ